MDDATELLELEARRCDAMMAAERRPHSARDLDKAFELLLKSSGYAYATRTLRQWQRHNYNAPAYGSGKNSKVCTEVAIEAASPQVINGPA